ncbi:hypothetical protein BC940DRAFT_260124 [Gongronella butleri]|nr:hypothetical protein BC940DRAFT_260124 [Gongronella butleri]
MGTHGRMHSNTVSGERPDIQLTRPDAPRRNSDGATQGGGVARMSTTKIVAPTPVDEEKKASLALDDFKSTGGHEDSTSSSRSTPLVGNERHDHEHERRRAASATPIRGTPPPSRPSSAASASKAQQKSKDASSVTPGGHPRRFTVSGNGQIKPLTTTQQQQQQQPLQQQQNQQNQQNQQQQEQKPNHRPRTTSHSTTATTTTTTTPAVAKITSSDHPSRRGSAVTLASSDSDNRSLAAGSIATAVGAELATEKRNQEFHALFRSIPEDEVLLEDFGCALHKEILVQGRLYISENYLCFNANIFGWVTNLVIAFEDIVDIEKRTTALVIPNAIQVSTQSSKHFFTSFLSRDQAWDLMVDIWRYSRHPSNHSMDESYDDDDDDAYQCGDSDTITGSDASYDSEYASTDAASVTDDAKEDATPRTSNASRRRAKSESDARAQDASGPAAAPEQGTTGEHQAKKETDCICRGDHFDTVVMDKTYRGTLEAIYNLLYHSDFFNTFMLEKEKSGDLKIGDWQNGDGAPQTRTISYIKPLNGSIGPKQTQCNQEEKVLACDFKDSATILKITHTPDVPSGGSFCIKTKTCLTWAGYGRVRIFVTCKVDFSKSSWLKSTIEKASIDGQIGFYNNLDASLREYMKAHASEFGGEESEGRRRRKRRSRRHGRRGGPNQQNEHIQDKPLPPNPWQATIRQACLSAGEWVLDIGRQVYDLLAALDVRSSTLLCMLSLVVLNVFIATRMAHLERQLALLQQQPQFQQQQQQKESPWFSSNDPAGGAMADGQSDHAVIDDHVYNQALWDWLASLDPNANDSETVTVAVEPPDMDAMAKVDVFDRDAASADNTGHRARQLEHLFSTKKTKLKVEHNLQDIARLIRRAERNIGHVTQNVHRQRQMLQRQVAV